MVTIKKKPFKPDFSKPNPYEDAPEEYFERIRGTQAYKTAVKRGWITDVPKPEVEEVKVEEAPPIEPEEVAFPIEEEVVPKKYITTQQFDFLKQFQREGTLGQKTLTEDLWLTPRQAAELGYYNPEGQDYLLSPTETGNVPLPERPPIDPELIQLLRGIYPEKFAPEASYGFTEAEIPAMVLNQVILAVESDYAGFVSDLYDRVGEEEAARLLRALGISEEYVLGAMSYEKQNERITETVQAVFPGYEISDLVFALETDFEGFIRDIQTDSLTVSWQDKRRLLEQMGLQPEEINEILRYRRTVVPVDGVSQLVTVDINTQAAYDENGDYVGKYNWATREFTEAPDKNILQNTWDTLVFHTNQYAESAWAFLLGAAVPLLYPDMPEGFLGSFGEEITRQNREMREYSRNVYFKMKSDYDTWSEKHPEIRPSTAYMEGALQHPELLGDPSYWAYEVTSMIPFVLTSLALTVATGGTGSTFIVLSTLGMGAVEGGAVYEDLINAGATPDQAAPIAAVAGGIIGSLESFGRIPLLRQLNAGLFGRFKQRATSELARRSFTETVKRFGRNFTVAQLTEVATEMAQEVVGNVAVGFFNENLSALEGIGDIAVKTFVATAPLAVLGGATSIRMVGPSELRGLSDVARKAKGWVQDNKGNWFEVLREEVTLRPERGALVPGAEPGRAGRAERERLELVKKDKARVERGIEEGTIEKAVGNKQIESLDMEISNLEKQLEGVPVAPAEEVPSEIKIPEQPDVVGKEISDITGLRYDGVQEGLGLQFTDIEQTGTTFYANTIEEARTKLETKRREFAEAEASIKLEQARRAAEEAPAEVRGAYEAQAEAEGLRVSQQADPVAQARFKLGGKNVDLTAFISIREQTFPEYFTRKQATALLGREPAMAGNRIPRDVALDDLSKQLNMTPDQIADRVMAIRQERRRIKELEAEIKAQMTEKPLTPKTELTTVEVAENWKITGKPKYTLKQINALVGFFADYINNPNVVTAWELTRELRRETLAGRAESLKARAQFLIVQEGITSEEAMARAIRETMSGELPTISTQYLEEMTADLRDALFAKVYHVLKNEPFEMMSTVTALTNALIGRPIPREPGVRGGSAYTRLQRVFGDQPKVLRAIDRVATEKKPLEDIVEGIYRETGGDPIPVDQETADYLRGLSTRVIYEPTALMEPVPVTRYEAPIEDAIDQLPLFPKTALDKTIRVLKEIGMSPVDIGNFLRANKASFDFSFWRQQAPLIVHHPVSFVHANIEAWNAIWSQKSAESSWQRITRDPLYQIYEVCEQNGGDFLRPLIMQKGTAQYKGTEEFGYYRGATRLIPRLTGKLPWVKLSARSFETGTNVHNWLIFRSYYSAMLRLSEQYASGKKKLKPGESFDVQKEMVDFSRSLANFSARGSLGKFSVAAPELSGLFFAPRAAIGRILSVKDLVNANSRVRMEAWKNAATFVGTFGGIVLLGAAVGWWDVELDPRSAEYMSIRIGNTRIDPWGGFRQFLVFFTRAITQTGVSSVTGAEYKTDPLDLMQNLIRGKASPLASLFLDFWKGRNFVGEEVDVANKRQWAERVAPFSVWDIYEAWLEDPQTALQIAIPAIVGAGVQTYTGEWRENWAKLGLPKYSENLVYGMTQPYYDTQDFYADHSNQFTDVDPATLTKEKGFPPYIRALAEAKVIKSALSELPNEKLVDINADPSKGATFADYYRMWREREEIVASGDEEKLKEFDKKYPQAELGNFSQRQFSLLNEYWSITDEQAQKDFLKEHESEIGVNPRQEYLRTHPKENALLAVWGQAKILSREAYTEFKKLIKELDIPDNAIPEMTLPPEESIDNYFTYQEQGSELGYNSWEVQLLLANDDELREWLGRQPIDTPIEALELKVKNREHYDAYGELETDEERKQYKLDNPEWVDDTRRIEAIENNGMDYQEDWVDRGHVVDEFTAGSSEAKVWLLDHPEIWQWALDNELLTDDGEDWNRDVLRINAQYATEDDEYNAILGTDREARAAYLETHPDYRQARRRREALQLTNSETGERFPTEQVENYIMYYELGEKGFRRERFLIQVPAFAEAMHNIAGIDIPNPQDVPSVEYDNVYDEWQEDFDKWEGLSNNESEHYIEDTEARDAERERMMFTTGDSTFSDVTFYGAKRLTGFGLAVITREAHDKLRGLQGDPNYQSYVSDYVQYYKLQSEGKPDKWADKTGTDLWYEDDWFLMENMDFYENVYKGVLGNQKRDFRKVPTREVFNKYLQYLRLIEGKPRDDYREAHPDLDAWLVDKFGYTPIEEKKRREELTPLEKAKEEIAEQEAEWNRQLEEIDKILAGID